MDKLLNNGIKIVPCLIGCSNFSFTPFFFSLKEIETVNHEKNIFFYQFLFSIKKSSTPIVSVAPVVFSPSDETPSVTSSSSISSISSDTLFSSVSVVDALSSTNSDTSEYVEIFCYFILNFRIELLICQRLNFTFDIISDQHLWHTCFCGRTGASNRLNWARCQCCRCAAGFIC